MCARTQFMTDSFLWADRPIMSKTNETMKHNAEAAQFHPGQPSSHRQSRVFPKHELIYFLNITLIFSDLSFIFPARKLHISCIFVSSVIP